MPSPRQRILKAVVSEPPSQFVSDHLIERIPYLFWRHVGSGQYDTVRLSEEAAEYFQRRDVEVQLMSTPEALTVWNDAPKKSIGLFHVTC